MRRGIFEKGRNGSLAGAAAACLGGRSGGRAGAGLPERPVGPGGPAAQRFWPDFIAPV